MNHPLTCFKYRSLPAALRCLNEDSLYFAAPNELNDTLEAKYDHASPQDFIQVMGQTYNAISAQRGGPTFELDQQEMAKFATANASDNEHLQLFTDRIGIFSAARRPNHQAMWAYYADNASGVCFELEWDHDIVNRYQLWAADVTYCNKSLTHNRAEDWRTILLELSQAHPNAKLDELHHMCLGEKNLRKLGIITASRAASVKHTDWAHEQEIRILAPKARTLPLLGQVLKRVHFVRTDGKHWGKIMQIIQARYPSVKLMRWQFGKGELSDRPTPMEFRFIPV